MTSPIVADPAQPDPNVAAGLTRPTYEPRRRGKHRAGSRAGLVLVSAMCGVQFPPQRRRRTAV